jgi:tetratricopeptide (TPR) repeat protein
MQQSFLRCIFCIAIVLATAIPATFAQQNELLHSPFERPISVSDSILVNRYVDSINNAPLFSRKRQRYYDSALTIKPWKASWWQQKGMPLMKKGKYEAGMRFLDSAVKYDAKRYLDYRAFMKCIFQKSYRESIKDFELAKTVIGAGEVMDHTYDFYIGLCYLQLDDLDSAACFLEATTKEQLKARGEGYVHPLDLFYLGIVYYEKENYPKAMEAFDKSLKLYKNFSDVQYYKACCLIRQSKYKEALALMTEANENFKQGYTINEDNVIHEKYPYQVYKATSYEDNIKQLQLQLAAN